MRESIASIHAFWFGMDPMDDARIAQARSRLWWSKDPANDAAMRDRFADTVAAAGSGRLDGWKASPQGRLALILLSDQFPRNIYRGTPQAFAFDRQAIACCRQGLRHGDHHRLRPIERVFFYLPLEHTESMEDQERAVVLFTELRDTVPIAQRPAFDDFLRFAQRHRDVIRRFGRFPHRNAILDRVSTPQELAFLEEKGSSF